MGIYHRKVFQLHKLKIVSNSSGNFTFILLCIEISFFSNNQPDALIIPILFCYKTLHVSGNFSAHHQEFSTVHSALVSFMQVYDDRFQAESGGNYVSGIFSAHHQEFSTVHSALVSFMQLYDDRFQAESGWNCSAVPS